MDGATTKTDSETTDSTPTTEPVPTSNIATQVQSLLTSARSLEQTGSGAAAKDSLRQATELAQTLQDEFSRDRLLRSIGLALVEIDALDAAWAIAQTMSYKTYEAEGLRSELENALIAAYIQSDRTPQAVSLIEALQPAIRDQYWVEAIETLAEQRNITAAAALIERIGDSSYFRYLAINAVSRAYIGARQFETA